jgi:ATP/maltotriose-dependent transcriptional regulator MalT
VAQRCAVSDVTTLSRLALGRVRIFRGDVVSGIRLLDEAMVSVLAGETSPIVVGDGFCTAIDACHDVVDVRRGQAWTAAFGRWCDAHPGLVAFAGVCQVHRAEFLQLRGAWVEAVAQAGLARARLSAPVAQVALGAAIYQQGELHRLCGRADEAEQCFREASAHGRDPQPGLALLRLAQGHTDAAARGLERALAESAGEIGRPQLLAAQVEVALAVGDVPVARHACGQLAGLSRSLSSPMLAAVSDRATGAIELAEGDAAGALAPLRRAISGFRSLGATYEVARTGVLISRARRALVDEEGAALEEAASRSAFTALGASADLAELDAGSRRRQAPHQQAGQPGALTGREVQVLGLVARGSTNREIGVELGLSERTVDRHVSNIFGKLGVSSRAAATAMAYEHHLL